MDHRAPIGKNLSFVEHPRKLFCSEGACIALCLCGNDDTTCQSGLSLNVDVQRIEVRSDFQKRRNAEIYTLRGVRFQCTKQLGESFTDKEPYTPTNAPTSVTKSISAKNILTLFRTGLLIRFDLLLFILNQISHFFFAR